MWETTLINEVKPFQLPWKVAVYCSWAYLKQELGTKHQYKVRILKERESRLEKQLARWALAGVAQLARHCPVQ